MYRIRTTHSPDQAARGLSCGNAAGKVKPDSLAVFPFHYNLRLSKTYSKATGSN